MILILFIGCVFTIGVESVDYVNPYLGGIPLPRFNVPTFPYVGLPGGGLRIYPPRIDFTTDFLSGIPVCNKDFRTSTLFVFSPQQATDSSLIRVIDYSFDLERVTPYNYSVYLDESQIRASFAVTKHCAIHEFYYENNGNNNYLVFNPSSSGQINVSFEDGGRVKVSAQSSNYCIYLEFESQPQSCGELVRNIAAYKNTDFSTGNAVVFNFGTSQKTVRVKYGISTQSTNAAKNFLKDEISNYDLSEISVKGRAAWSTVMNKFNVSGGDDSERRLFFTAVYRTYESITTRDLTSNLPKHSLKAQTNFVDPFFSKSYEALHPLLTLIEPEMEVGFINSIVSKIESQTRELMTKISAYKVIHLFNTHTMKNFEAGNSGGSDRETNAERSAKQYDDLLEYYHVAGVVFHAHAHGIIGPSQFNHAFAVLRAHNEALSEFGRMAMQAARAVNGPNGPTHLLSAPHVYPSVQHAFYSERGFFPFLDHANHAARRDTLRRLAASQGSAYSHAHKQVTGNDNGQQADDDEFMRLTRSFTDSYTRAQQSVAATFAAAESDYYMARIAQAVERQTHTRSNGPGSSSFFLNRSHSYRALFNGESQRFEPRDEDGVFVRMSRSVRELVATAARTHTRKAFLRTSNRANADTHGTMFKDERFGFGSEDHASEFDLDGERVYLTNPYDLPTHNLTDIVRLFATATAVSDDGASGAKMVSNGETTSAWDKEWLSVGKQRLLAYVESLARNPPRHPQYDHLNFIPRTYTMGQIGTDATVVPQPLAFAHIYGNIARLTPTPRTANADNWKTQKQVRFNIQKNYRNDLEGIPSDYDGGNMFAGVVWAALGLYPGSGDQYIIGSPWFANATVRLGDDTGSKTLTVTCSNWAKNNKYIHTSSWNGRSFSETTISRSYINGGGQLTFVMGEKPNRG